jgi:hypothetical protein
VTEQLAPYRPTRRAIVVVPDHDLDRILTTEARLDLGGARILDLRHDPVYASVLLLITRDDLDEVTPGAEPPRIPATIIEPDEDPTP